MTNTNVCPSCHVHVHNAIGYERRYFGVDSSGVTDNVPLIPKEGSDVSGVNGLDSVVRWRGVLSRLARYIADRAHGGGKGSQRRGGVLYCGVRLGLDSARDADRDQEGGGAR